MNVTKTERKESTKHCCGNGCRQRDSAEHKEEGGALIGQRITEVISLPEMFDTVLYSFISKQTCGQKQKDSKESICRRFLKSLEDSGVTFFGDIQPDHVRSFIVKISETWAKNMDDIIYAL